MKMTNGIHIVETNDFLKNIWEREGYVLVKGMNGIEETKEEDVVDSEIKDEKEMGLPELRTLAKELGINTYKMSKQEIIDAVKKG